MNEIVFISLTKNELIDMIREAVREELAIKKEKELMNFSEACEFLGCSRSFLNRCKSENKVPYKKLGKRVFFHRKELIDALKDSYYYKLKELGNY